MDARPDLNRYLQSAPTSPGVYVMKATSGEVLYVGKARNLRSRLKAYLSGTDSRPMVPFLISKTFSIEFIVTDTEKDALILEYNLIKKHRPRYNIEFRDDKAYFHLRIDPSLTYPRFQLIRRPKHDAARYFGPYPSSRAARETLRFLHTLFPLRTCRDEEMKNRTRPCLEHEIRRCSAPCVKKIDSTAYGELVRQSIAFLEGKSKDLVNQLEKKMLEAAQEERFEEAAQIRDRLLAIRSTLEKQTVFSLNRKNRDVFGLYQEGAITQISVIFVREGRVIGQRSFPIIKSAWNGSEIMRQFLFSYYGGGAEIPEEIILPLPIQDKNLLAEWLTDRKGKKVRLISPRGGELAELVQLATANASQLPPWEDALSYLGKLIGMPKAPERIECYDISHLGGTFTVGSRVTFYLGKPMRSAYRHYRLSQPEEINDYAMMYKVLQRRLAKDSEPYPDLIVVDGGKGQLNAALSILKDMDREGIHVVALAKGEGKGEDHLYLPYRKNPVFLKRHPVLIPLLTHIRDEAHRFALSYHRRVRGKGDFATELDTLVGKKKKLALLTYFSNLDEIKEASTEELKKAKGIGEKTALKIWHHFHGGNNG